MRIGISTASFYKKRYTEESFEIIQKIGIPIVETFLACFSEYQEDFIKIVNEKRKNTKVISVHTLSQQFEPDLFNAMDRARNDSEYVFRKVAHAASLLDAPFYTFHGPAKLRHVEYNLNYEKLGQRTEELCAILRESSNKKTSLCYENVHWCYFNEPSFIENLKKYSPSIKTCLDIKQALQSGFSPSSYIKSMGNRLTNVHLCDYNGKNTLLPGQGDLDFTKLFDELLSCGYHGDALIELYSGDYESFDDIERCYNYLNECLYKVQR